MSVLESRYRRVLRLLPAWYRSVWEDEMVATFLDRTRTGDPEQDEWLAWCGRPGRAEVASVVALAARLRLGGAEAPPQSVVWGEAVRLIALVGLLANAVGGASVMLTVLWHSGGLPWLPLPPDPLTMPPPVATPVTAVLWLAAFLALLGGRARVAAALAVGALLPAIVSTVASAATAALAEVSPPFALSPWLLVLVDVLVVLALAAFHRDAPRVEARPWVVAFGVGTVLALGLVLAQARPAPEALWTLLDPPGVWAVLLVATAVVQLARRGGPTPAWALALSLLVAAVVVVRLVWLAEGMMSMPEGAGGAATAVGVAQVVTLLAVGWPLALRARAAARGGTALIGEAP